MKTNIFILLILTLQISTLATESNINSYFSKEVRGWLSTNPEIVIGVDRAYPPFEYQNLDGEYVGISMDYLDIISDMTGLQFSVKSDLSWTEILQQAESGEVDLVSNVGYSKKRSEYLVFSDPYQSAIYTFVTNKENKGLSLEEFTGQKVGVQKNTIFYDKLVSENVELHSYDNPQDGVLAVALGEIDAYIDNLPVINYWIERDNHSNLLQSRVSNSILPAEGSYFFGISKKTKYPYLRRVVDVALRNIPEESIISIERAWTPSKRTIEDWEGWDLLFFVTFVLIVMVFLYIKSIQKRRILEEKAREKFRIVADFSSGWEIWISPAPELKVLYMNNVVENIIGYSVDECVNNPKFPYFFIHKDDHPIVEKLYDIGSEGNPIDNIEVRMIHKNGTIQWCSLSQNPVYGEAHKYLGARISVRDINTQKDLEVELRSAKNIAESATEAKSTFLANMSHEIRTPMNAIIGLSHIALQKRLSPQIRDYLTKIERASTSLLNIINDILDFSKIEAGKINLEEIPFNLNEVIANLNSINVFRAQEKGITFSTVVDDSVPSALIGDSLRLGQVLLNLASNAIKFTESGDVTVFVTHSKTEDEKITLKFSVKDSGIGMTKKQQSSLFKSFHQADDSITRRYGGTGLGLAISKSLVEEMGGEISVNSEEGKGSTFSFEAIFEACDENLINKNISFKSDEIDQVKRLIWDMKVLLVEDNEINQQVAVELLEGVGVQVDIANNGKIACEKVEQNSYELVLMDIQMPVMDGYQATEEIRKTVQAEKLPIIAMTANAMSGDRAEAMNSGMQGQVTKPIRPLELFRSLAQWRSIDKRNSAVKTYSHEQEKQEDISIDFSQLKSIDVNDALERISYNSSLYLDLLKKFTKNYSEVIKRAQTCLVDNDREGAVRELHTLKSVAGNLGVSEIQAIAATWESSLAKGATIKELEIEEPLELPLSTTISEIKDFIANHTVEKKEELLHIDPESFKKKLTEVKKLIQEDDTAVIDILKELQLYSSELSSIVAATEAYDFDTALEELNNFLETSNL
jgi:PAS domain S-box-containing protein